MGIHFTTEGLGEALALLGQGWGGVFIVLALIMGSVYLLRSFDKLFPHKDKE